MSNKLTRALLPIFVCAIVAAATFALGQAIRSSNTGLRPVPKLPPVAPPPLPDFEASSLIAERTWVEQQISEGNPDLRLLDVRSEGHYLSSRLPDALRVDLPYECIKEGIDCVREQLGELGLSGHESMVLYGGPRDGTKVATLFWLLEWAGAQDLKILEGTTVEWWRENRPLELEPPKPRPASSLSVSVNENVVADVRWMDESYGQMGVEVLDLRDSGVWTESRYAAPPAFTAGHIPYSLPFDFRPETSEQPWLEPEDGWDRLRRLGPRLGTYINPKAEIVIYSDGPSNPRLGRAYLTLRRMGAKVRVFAGGWSAWTAEPENPVVRIVTAEVVASLLKEHGASLRDDTPPRDFIFLDLREASDFNQEHLPGAYNLPEYHMQPFTEGLERALSEQWAHLNRAETPIILYCYGRECVRSREASQFVARAGFRDIWWLRDGVEAWEEAGLPLLRDTAG